ncbi:cysteine sulfinic acid decarboxylase isoform X2 [Passer montanus]|uniref:cysteine sulfinic acid decarboxylase isoform X2 n=1 Tax=Passer montanus TaxID=9160 RepID=UPI0019604C5E|nr:cysteine sulfinic acid decarboxylase isoform X2 [Passer montanus]
MAEPSGAGDSIPLDGPGLDMAAGEEFLQEVFRILLEEGVRKSTDVTQKVCDWKEPQELRELLDLELRSDGEGRERLLQRCRDVLRFSVRTGALPVHTSAHRSAAPGQPSASQFSPAQTPCGTAPPASARLFPGHPRFFNQLFSGLDHHALAGRFLTETLNTSPYTYEVAPVLVLMEEQVLATLRELVGWSSGDGIFAPGGSISNMLAMNVARFWRFPESRSRGNWDLPRLGLFASQEGEDDPRRAGEGDPEGESRDPSLIPPRARSPSLCVPRVAPLSWAPSTRWTPSPTSVPATGCGCMWIADSVTWNPHKLLMVGLQCSAFLLRDSSGLLQRCHGVGASYLFQRDKFYDVSLDTGDKSPQCGRRADGLKLWILWKAVGTKGLAQRVERAFGATRYLLEQVKRREGFQLVMEPEFINLCFWFIPPSLRGQESSPEFWDKLGKVAPAIKEKMIRRGSMMVGYQPHGSQVNFFRQIITNPAVTRQDLDFFLDEIQELGWDL